MRRANEPSTGRQIGVSLALLVIDLMLIAWSVYGVGIAGWADSYESDGVVPSSASQAASQAMWLLGGGAVLTGGGLLALGWRLPGIVQLVVLGSGTVLVSSLAAG
ncbi:hypothetical protein [Streptomyces dubilierae]|uniref:MFS transporter n=1 Tax=Streptomyces dubilierae TaxID=3075533 RepID=A0ABU2PBR4_9ACTN|nr:hypothetical protein [Streptomyces sp. DSM 41921]MDT0389272.1 hypothetical protein [Streptomyces sp. DSM 41921]